MQQSTVLRSHAAVILVKLISPSRTAKVTLQSRDFHIKRHVSYKMALGNGGASLCMLFTDVLLWLGMILGVNVEWLAHWVLHYGTIRPPNYAYIARSHVCFHGNKEECDKPKMSVLNKTIWLRTASPTYVALRFLPIFVCSARVLILCPFTCSVSFAQRASHFSTGPSHCRYFSMAILPAMIDVNILHKRRQCTIT